MNALGKRQALIAIQAGRKSQMKRNLKALGLALAAVFALSAVAASAAQAANHHLAVPTAPAIITAEDESTEPVHFAIGGGEHKVSCGTADFRGTVSATKNTEVTVSPEYTECKVDGFNATVDVNHCAFILKGETDVNGHATGGLECESPDEITITYSPFGASCVLHIKPASYTGIHYTQTTNATTGKQDVTVKLTLKNIHYVATSSSTFFCGIASGTYTDGELTGGVTAQAYKDEIPNCALTGTEKTTPKTKLNECEGAVQNLELGAT